jgi:hypothetical protein
MEQLKGDGDRMKTFCILAVIFSIVFLSWSVHDLRVRLEKAEATIESLADWSDEIDPDQKYDALADSIAEQRGIK